MKGYWLAALGTAALVTTGAAVLTLTGVPCPWYQRAARPSGENVPPTPADPPGTRTSFPTPDPDAPPELLGDLLALCRERQQWLGIGLAPPRQGKERWIRATLDRVPDGVHVHGWALRQYTHVRRLDSVDSTNWFRDGMAIRQQLPWLTYGEALEIVVKRYQRWQRVIRDKAAEPDLFSGLTEDNTNG